MNKIAKKLVEITQVEIEHHSGTNEYEEGVIRLSYFNGTFIDTAVKNFIGRPVTKNAFLYHELGHAVADMYGINEYKETEKLFGDFDETYHGTPMLLLSSTIVDDDDFISAYAQTHPEEDWADTFAYVVENYSSIKGKPKTLLDKKIHYVKEWIKEIMEG